MFDLEKAIADWRRDLAAHGLRSSEDLDELESHLRDELEAQIESGASPREAWIAAAHGIGEPAALKNEFARAAGITDALRQIGQTLSHFAGLTGPHQTTLMTMSLTPAIIRSRRATYLEAAVFLFPSVAAAIFFNLFLFPKLQWFQMKTGMALPTVDQILRLWSEHAVLVCAPFLALLILLEWRSTQWPRYRRTAVGSMVLLFNVAILFITTSAIITLLVAMPKLMHPAN